MHEKLWDAEQRCRTLLLERDMLMQRLEALVAGQGAGMLAQGRSLANGTAAGAGADALATEASGRGALGREALGASGLSSMSANGAGDQQRGISQGNGAGGGGDDGSNGSAMDAAGSHLSEEDVDSLLSQLSQAAAASKARRAAGAGPGSGLLGLLTGGMAGPSGPQIDPGEAAGAALGRRGCQGSRRYAWGARVHLSLESEARSQDACVGIDYN